MSNFITVINLKCNTCKAGYGQYIRNLTEEESSEDVHIKCPKCKSDDVTYSMAI